MKLLGTVLMLLVLTATSAWAADNNPEKKIVKPWTIGIGPAVSGSLPGNNGTKFFYDLSHNFGISEYFDWHLFYNASYNSASFGTSQLAIFGAGLDYWWKDRGADTSPIIAVELGYGGSNRNWESGWSVAGEIGAAFFRTSEWEFRVSYKRVAIFAPSNDQRNFNNNPQIDQIQFAVSF